MAWREKLNGFSRRDLFRSGGLASDRFHRGRKFAYDELVDFDLGALTLLAGPICRYDAPLTCLSAMRR